MGSFPAKAKPRGHSRRKLVDPPVDEMMRLRRAGLSRRRIARLVGLSRSSVWRLIRIEEAREMELAGISADRARMGDNPLPAFIRAGI